MRRIAPMALLLLLLLSAGCTDTAEERTVLRVVAAGSVLAPLSEIEAEYERQYPGVDVRIEGHGSIQVIRQVTDLHRPVDVVIVADESLIPELMYRPMAPGAENFTDGYIPFATNAMVIAYTDGSAGAGEITPENWHEILARPDVRVGFSNPILDACGYRALMVAKLAEGYYGDDSIFSETIGNHLTPPPVVTASPGSTEIALAEMVKPEGQKVGIRDGSVFLLALLDAGGLDYAFEYRSVAEDHGLRWIDLPAEIDLSSDEYAEEYRKVTVRLGFQRFSSIGLERPGLPIVYAVAIPANAPNPDEAERFIGFMLEAFGEGRQGWPEPIRRG